ncbi:MAG: 23S rRNA (uracil(1939)-C(5))-methyltransferase RlmD [Negativicutes bacterium]|nr:23S rRNA (uracil(1939)-C(5))-methyltransferase RlmD [Negativicutes bacterium]
MAKQKNSWSLPGNKQTAAAGNMSFSVHQQIEITADNIGINGEGVARYQNLAVFCDGLLPGETAKAEINEIHKTFLRATLLEILVSSPQRQQPPCQYYAQCGGCQLQHWQYEAQTAWKELQVKEQLRRLAKIEPELQPILAAEQPYAYRNKIQMPAGLQDGKKVIGLYEKNSHRIVDIKRCLLQSPLGNKVLQIVREEIFRSKLSFYHETANNGLLRHIMIRTNREDTLALLTLVINGLTIPDEKQMIENLVQQIPELSGIVLNYNTEKGNTVLGEKSRLLWGFDTLEDQIGEATFLVSDRSFFQVNRFQTERLYQIVAAYAKKAGAVRLLDAYCGIGSIGLFLAKWQGNADAELSALDLQQIIGVEIAAVAVKDAEKNTLQNRVSNATYYTGKCEDVLPKLAQQGISVDCAVFDPPRQGCQPEFLQAIAKARINNLIYVSCNPNTLARDVALLRDLGYEVVSGQAVDMFPMTTHVETVVLLTKCG